MIATWRLETGNGSSYLWKHHFNAGGIKNNNNEYKSYSNEEQGLNDLKTLLRRYVNKYGYDIKAIRNEYCPITDLGCAGDYEKFIEIYEGELKKYE